MQSRLEVLLGLRIILKIISLVVILGSVSCSHGKSQVALQSVEEIYRDTPVQIDLDVSKRDLNKVLKDIRVVIGKKDLNEQGIVSIERLYVLYSTVRASAKNQILSLPPSSRLKVNLPSYCLDPSRVVPSEYEPFMWTKEDPGVPYYSKLIKAVSRDTSFAQQDAQELIWNLRNRANYEDYPPNLRKVLDQIDPNAKLVLPSSARSAAIEMVHDSFPEAEIVEEAFSLIEGHYYSYSDVANNLRLRTQSSTRVSQKVSPSHLDSKPGVYTLIKSSGFLEQEVVFFNTSRNVVGIDLSEYFLKPINSEIQRIGLSMQAGFGHSILSTIEAGLKDTIIRNSAYWYAGRLTPAEMDFIKNYPIEALNAYAQSRRAILSTWKYYGRNSDGDESDAFRHFVWAGLLVQQLGEELAREFLSAHEHVHLNAPLEDQKSLEMDQWNNAEGMEYTRGLLGKGEFSIDRLEKEAYAAVIQGRLRVLLHEGNGLLYPVSQ